MSYKRLGDPRRQKALVPFLTAAAGLDGHLVAIAVDKKKKWLSLPKTAYEPFLGILNLTGSWNPKSLEEMMRKVHFMALLTPIWAGPNARVTWITDEDEFIANASRHNDVLQTAARMTSLYSPRPMHTLRINSTDQDIGEMDYEDLCAIPDLAAGMLSEVASGLNQKGSGETKFKMALHSELPTKAQVLANWFWDEDMRLRKTFITIDTQETKFTVRKI